MGHFVWMSRLNIFQSSSLPVTACIPLFIPICSPPFFCLSLLVLLPLLPTFLPNHLIHACLPTWICLPSTCSPCLSVSLALSMHSHLLSCTLPLFLLPVSLLAPVSPTPSFLAPFLNSFLSVHNCRQTLNDLGSCMASSDIIFLFNWMLHC